MTTPENAAARLRELAVRVDEQTEGEAVSRLLEFVAQEDDRVELRDALVLVGAREVLLAEGGSRR